MSEKENNALETQEEQQVQEPKYKMKKLSTMDLFKMSKILKKLNLKIEKGSVAQGEVSLEQGGLLMMVDLIQKALENLHMAEDEVSEFLAHLVKITPEEFKELPLEDTFEIIEQFKDQKAVGDFLKRHFGSTK